MNAHKPDRRAEPAPAVDFLTGSCAAMASGVRPRYPWFKRRLPDALFYLVPALMWGALALRHGSLTLPTVANPAMEVGGLWGESKAQGLNLFGPLGRTRLARFIEVVHRPEDTPATVEALLHPAGMHLPVVAKPDRGYQGWGVRLLSRPDDLAAYLATTPEGARILLQEWVRHPHEAGIFYIREPGADHGRIVSLTFVLPPQVTGDGIRTVAELAAADPVLRPNLDIYRSRKPDSWSGIPPAGEVHALTDARSARLGAVYRDATHLVTPDLDAAIDAISREIPDFHFGRFDIRFRSPEALFAGEGFRILELNGAGAEMLHIWDGATSLRTAWATLWRQYRSLFAIGAAMRRRGHRPAGLAHMIRLQREQEALRRAYPASM